MIRKIGLALFAALIVAAPQDARAMAITLTPSATNFVVGDSFTVDLGISGLGNLAGPSLGAFDVDIGFDPSILDFTGASFGGFLGDPFLDAVTGVDASLPGTANLFEVSFLFDFELDALQPDSFVLATLSFDALALGINVLTASPLAFADAFGNVLSVAAANPATISVANPVSVAEPGSAAIFLIGLAALGLSARRRPRGSA